MPLTKDISSRELMEEICMRAALEFLQAVKKENNSSDNLLVRAIKGLHSNTAFNDLTETQRNELRTIAQSMFGFVNGKGFILVPKEKRTK